MIINLSILKAEEINLIKDQWKLLGTKSTINDMSIFDNSCVEILWTYNSNWNYYSNTHTDITQYDKMTSLEDKQGFWILPNSNCALSVPNSTKTIAEVSYDDINNSWKLLGANYEITDLSIFDINCVDVVWKYNNSNQWELYDPANKYMYDTKISSIDEGDGFWIKGKENKNCNISFSTNESLKNITFLNKVDLTNELTYTESYNKKTYKNYRFDIWSNYLTIYNITNPSIPVEISSLTLNNSTYINSEYWDINDKYLVIPYHSGGFEVIDISDIANPISIIDSDDEYEELLDYKGMNYYGGVDSVYLNGDNLILSIEIIGKRILNINNPSSILNTINKYYFEDSAVKRGMILKYGKNIINVSWDGIQILNPETLGIISSLTYELPNPGYQYGNYITNLQRTFIKDNILYVIANDQVYTFALN